MDKKSKLTLIERLPKKNSNGNAMGLYLCECGNKKEIAITRVEHLRTLACGCLPTGKKTHGMRYTPEYETWRSIKERCLNKSGKDYARYGGKGITICDTWSSFENFFADMGNRPEGTSIDRIDNSKGYSPENCRWATKYEQQRNRFDRYVYSIRGITFQADSEAAKYFGVTRETIRKWCCGWVDKRRNRKWEPRNDCKRILRYETKNT